MEQPDPPQAVSQIQTFVFMDTESTGLPQDNPRITELCLVAVSRAHLLEMETMTGSPPGSKPPRQQAAATLTPPGSSACAGRPTRKNMPRPPRVLHKYTRLYYPWKIIPAAVEGVTGLSNEVLEHLPSFSEASAEALRLFLDLPGPVALLSHNGTRLDFPLLMAELKRVNCVNMFMDLKCVDTLIAIRDIDGLTAREEIPQITKLAEASDFNNFEDEFPAELSHIKRSRTKESGEGDGTSLSNTAPSPLKPSPYGNGNTHPAMEGSPEPLVTPVKSRPPRQTSTLTTPAKPAQSPPQPCTPGTPQPGTSGLQPKGCKGSGAVRRNMTYGSTGWRVSKMPHRQPVIYSRLFGSEYEAHRAEEDCMALLAICGHYGAKLVEWADTFATSFVGVRPMWEESKSFHIDQEG